MNTIEKVLTQSGADIDFAKLREMEAFTNELFNRVIAFQMKEHLAWDVQKPFADRIKDLSLHDLIFSSPDRDPEKFSHTIAPYYPLRYEIRKIAAYIKKISESPRVLDYPCANGFIGSLLAREGVNVTGLIAAEQKKNQIDPFLDEEFFQRRESLEGEDSYDAVFCSWMSSGVNMTPWIMEQAPKMIIYVYSDHELPESSTRQVGTDDMFDALEDHYTLLEEWQVTRPENILKEAWPDLTGNIKEVRKVRIYADSTISNRIASPELEADTPYDWEVDLDMATTVLQAKAFLKSRGMQV